SPVGRVVTCTGVPWGPSATQIRASASDVLGVGMPRLARPLANTIFPFGPGIDVAVAAPGIATSPRAASELVRANRTSRRIWGTTDPTWARPPRSTADWSHRRG